MKIIWIQLWKTHRLCFTLRIIFKRMNIGWCRWRAEWPPPLVVLQHFFCQCHKYILSLQSSLFLCMFHCLCLHVKSLSSSNTVHVLSCLILGIGFFSEMCVLFFSCGNPIWINVDNLSGKKGALYWDFSMILIVKNNAQFSKLIASFDHLLCQTKMKSS